MSTKACPRPDAPPCSKNPSDNKRNRTCSSNTLSRFSLSPLINYPGDWLMYKRPWTRPCPLSVSCFIHFSICPTWRSDGHAMRQSIFLTQKMQYFLPRWNQQWGFYTENSRGLNNLWGGGGGTSAVQKSLQTLSICHELQRRDWRKVWFPCLKRKFILFGILGWTGWAGFRL